MMIDLSPLWISLKVAGVATIATSLLGLLAAYRMMGYRGRGRSLIEGLLISPLILPPTVVGFLLLLLFGRTGLLGKLMQHFDLTIIFTWYAAVIAAVVVSFPLMYKTTLAAFEQIDASLLQVARTLGASEGRIFLQILLPLSIPGLLAGIILAFARSLGEFGATLMLAGNIPGQTQTMPMAVYYAVESGNLNEAWFWAIAIMIISLSSLIIVHFWQRQYERKIYGQGLREAYEPVNRGRTLIPFTKTFTGAQSQTGLSVDMTKQMANFDLNMAFTTQQESLGILGGSGSGKSMTLRCIAGVETPTQGRIVLNGKTLFDSAQQINLPSCRRKVGLVFQNYALFPHLTVAQNIAFGLQSLAKPLRQQQVQQHLARIQMQQMGDRYPHQLSGGQQQRVALARALATDPEVLLLDEPFSALDTYLRSQMEHQLLEVLSSYQGVTLFVTHNLEEAYRVCDKLLIVSGGSAIAHDVKHQIFEHPKTVRVAQLTGCKNFSQAIAQGSDGVRAIDWGIDLRILEAIPDRLTNVGIRAHQIKIMPDAEGDNIYPCWLAATSETPHRITLFLKFNAPAIGSYDYHVQAEIFKEKWHTLKEQPFPWSVQMDAARLILMVD
jgi:molybdate transport system permease protein